MAESNEPFSCPKKLQKKSVPNSTVYKNKWSAKVFLEWQTSRLAQVSVMEYNKNPDPDHIPIKTHIQITSDLDVGFSWVSRFIHR